MKQELPDPTVVFHSLPNIRPETAAESFMERVKSRPWCRGARSQDHTECDPVGGLDDALKEMINLGLALSDKVHFRKKSETIAVFLTERLFSVQCRTSCFPEPKIGGQNASLETPEQCTDYVLHRARELSVPDKGRPLVPVEVPELYWDDKNRLYCIKTLTGVWHHESKEDISARLADAGLDRRSNGDEPSEIEKKLIDIRDQKNISQMLPLAGYTAGLHTIKNRPVLVTTSFNLIDPKENPGNDKFPHIWNILVGLFGHDMKQLNYFMIKLKNDRACLMAGQKTGGLVTLIVGDPGIGKTLMMYKIIVPALGGRSANVFANLSGSTPFCAEQAQCEVWVIDDGNCFADRQARRAFANAVKQASANDDVWVHPKGKDGMSVPLYRRLFVLTNPDSIESSLPEMLESLDDKLMVLKAERFEMPEGLQPLPPLWDTAAVEALQETLRKELPYFLDCVDHYHVKGLALGERFGTAYKHPELWAEIKESSQDSDDHFLVQIAAFGSDRGTDHGQENQDGSVEFEINELLNELLENHHTADRAKVRYRSSKSLGSHLKTLRRASVGKHYSVRPSNGKSYWTVTKDEELISEWRQKPGSSKGKYDQ